MKLAQLAIERPVTVGMLTLSMVILGVMLLTLDRARPVVAESAVPTIACSGTPAW